MDITTSGFSPYKEYSLYKALKENRIGFYAIRTTKEESTEIIIKEAVMNKFELDIPKDYTVWVDRISIVRDDVKKVVIIRPVPFSYILLHKATDKWYAIKHWIGRRLGMS